VTDSDLLYGEVEEELRATVRKYLADRSPWQTVLALTEADPPRDPRVWRGLADVGVPGLAVPEEYGGAGASWREVAVVAEELGRSLAPTPFLGSAVLATAALLAVVAEGLDVAGVGTTLAELAAGASAAALAVPVSTWPGGTSRPAKGRGTSADPFGAVAVDAAGRLTGVVTSVADAEVADVLVVPAHFPAADPHGAGHTPDQPPQPGGDAEPGLFLVAAADVAVERRVTLDLTRELADVRLDGAAARPLLTGAPAAAALESALVTGAAVLASEQLGVAERCLELTVEHLRQRYQFGRPLGSFQALKHRLADLWVAVAQSRATARYAADRVAAGDGDAPVAAAVARAHGSPVAVRAAEECVQLHGGLGFTWEHPAHLYLKRARSQALALGTADRHLTRLAELVDLPPG
jgi:alkylation response protein AidB-like acyl-CoA dehydrogenase